MTDRETANNDTIKGLVLCFFLIIAFSIIPSTYVYTLVAEVASKSKHQQMISGVDTKAYWISAFMWDFLNYLIPAACSIALLYAFDVKAYIGSNLPATLTVFVLYGAASIALTYVLSFAFKDQNNALLACIALYAVSGFILFFVSWIMSLFPSTTDVDKNLRYIYMISPQYSFAMALYEIFFNDAAKLYSSAFDTECAGKMMLYLAVSTVIYLWLTILLQHSSTSQAGCLSSLFHRSPEVPPEELRKQDNDVEAEIELCDNTFPDENAPALAHTPIVVKHLRKVYFGRGNVSAKVAVRDLSFHVPEGQVFGFLGINGAGKTTSLSMLSGEFPPTSGEGYLAGMEMTGNREAINRTMGYCPQFDALFPKLTGREHLQLYARIKGIDHAQENAVVQHMISTMDLQDHADREAGGYSGGNKRKLSVAVALMGSPRIVFLDEPSTGMDPEARRYMWRVISSTMTGRSVILTTHSMEEAEALSHNVGIMVGGRLRCLGTTQHLKNKYGKGYSVELRTSDAKATSLKAWVDNKFPQSELEEEIGGQLRYEIPQENVHLSGVFRTLEQDREALGLADFSVSQTTLEQVFVRFAAQQEEETGMSAGQISAGMRESLPNFVDMCLCKPKTDYEWFIPPKNGQAGQGTRVAIHYNKAACFCGSNQGIVTIADYDVEDINDETGSYNFSGERTLDGSCGSEIVVLDDVSAPGCPDAPCIGCRDGCCGCSKMMCCQQSVHVFTEKGRTFEIVPFNEIPNSNRAHPCFLMVDGKDADTHVDRNVYLEEVFSSAAKRWCCIVALPLFLLYVAASATKVTALSIPVSMLMWVILICCVCGNCARSAHFKRTMAPAIPEMDDDMEGGLFSTTPQGVQPTNKDYNPLLMK
jgi:ABC-type multidrug transport system ATPase subunit